MIVSRAKVIKEAHAMKVSVKNICQNKLDEERLEID